MTTTVTHTIKTSGGDYSSLSAWEAAQQRDLVAVDQIAQAECYAGAYTDAVNISGWTTGSSNYVRIFTPTAERHDGRERAVSGVGCRFSNALTVLANAEDYLTVEGLELECTGTGNVFALALNSNLSASNEVIVDACILSGVSTNATTPVVRAGATNSKPLLKNCLVLVKGSQTGFNCTSAASGTKIHYCTIINLGTGTLGVANVDANVDIKNTYAGDFATEDFETASTDPTGSNNASSDTTATTLFTSSVANAAPADQFVSITGGAEDFHLKSGSSLIGAGTPLGAVTTDIDGEDRDGSTPDIGADERVVAATTTRRRGGGMIAFWHLLEEERKRQGLRPTA